MITLGEKIRLARKLKEKTIKEYSKECGCSSTLIDLMENNKSSVSSKTVQKLYEDLSKASFFITNVEKALYATYDENKAEGLLKDLVKLIIF